jgi:hypothetical protein
MNQKLQDILVRAEAWPKDVQDDLLAFASELELARTGVPYHATDEELAAIDEAYASGFAEAGEVARTFKKLAG